MLISSKCVLMKNHHVHVIRACTRKIRKPLLNRPDERGLALHDFAFGHGGLQSEKVYRKMRPALTVNFPHCHAALHCRMWQR